MYYQGILFLIFFLPVYLMQGLLGEMLFNFFDSQEKQILDLRTSYMEFQSSQGALRNVGKG